MKLDRTTYDKIQDLKILDVADKLQLEYSPRGSWRKALCFCHDDHSPSMGLNPSRNQWKCFSCGKGGSHINLVMEHEGLSFTDACEWLVREFNIPVSQQETRRSLIDTIKPKLMNTTNTQYLDQALLERFKGTDNEFTRALVSNHILTPVQMQHAAEVFRLSTASDSVIFWQIDRDNNIREGKVMYYQADAHRSHTRKPVTVSWLLKQGKQLPDDWKAKSCLFGLHQINDHPSAGTGQAQGHQIAIVESEKTAIICTELLASENFIWLATGGSSNLSVQSLQPLRGKKVIIFPDTDPTGTVYHDWLTIANEASRQFGHPITVSNILELHATDDQKHRKIDIADFIIESKTK